MGQDLAGGAQLSDSPVVAIMNGKGGVGKSTLALGLCAYTAQTHGAALLVDCDPQGTSYEITGLLADPGYDVVHELDASQFDKISQLSGYDLIVVDCPGPWRDTTCWPRCWPAPTLRSSRTTTR